MHEVNLCAKRVQCSERNTTAAFAASVDLFGGSVPGGTLDLNHRTGIPSADLGLLHWGACLCVPLGTLMGDDDARRSIFGVPLMGWGTFRRNVPIGTLVSKLFLS